MTKDIRINEAQEKVLRCAISLKEHIFDFDLEEKEFAESFGFTSGEIIEAFDELEGQLNEY